MDWFEYNSSSFHKIKASCGGGGGGGGGAHWPSGRTPDRETRVRSSAGSVCCFLEQETFTPPKVLVIPRNRWLRLNMTEKLFTGTLNYNQNKTKQKSVLCQFPITSCTNGEYYSNFEQSFLIKPI